MAKIVSTRMAHVQIPLAPHSVGAPPNPAMVGIRATTLAMSERGMNIQEIACAWNINPRTVKYRLLVAKKEAGRKPLEKERKARASARRKVFLRLDQGMLLTHISRDIGSNIKFVTRIAQDWVTARKKPIPSRGDKKRQNLKKSSPKETILDLLAKGFGPTTIARKVGVSVTTVTIAKKKRKAELAEKWAAAKLRPLALPKQITSKEPSGLIYARCTHPGCRNMFQRSANRTPFCDRHLREQQATKERAIDNFLYAKAISG